MLLLIVGVTLPIAASAQKDVRKNIRKGNREYRKENFPDAATLYGKAVEGNAASKEAAFNWGNALYRQQQWDQAIDKYNHYVSLEQENPEEASAAWHNIGNTMLHKKELEGSMEAYKMALRLNPEDDEARYNLAVVQKMMQDEEDQGGGEDEQQDDQQEQEQEQEQDQNQEQQQDQQPQNNQDQEQRPEESNQPEQMSRENARQLLQAIEQDERETQEKVQQIKAKEREEQAENNRRNNKNW